jgi:hypothetical protein
VTQPVESLSHAQPEQLTCIDFQLHLIDRFGVAPAGATRDLVLYRQIAVQNTLGEYRTQRLVLGAWDDLESRVLK